MKQLWNDHPEWVAVGVYVTGLVISALLLF